MLRLVPGQDGFRGECAVDARLRMVAMSSDVGEVSLVVAGDDT